jgi:ABC-type transporter Mla subunit MlaD
MSQSLEEVMAQFTANPEQLQTHLLEANAMSNKLTQLRTQADAMRTELADRSTLATVEELRPRLDALSAVAPLPPRGSYLEVNSPQEFKGARKELS